MRYKKLIFAGALVFVCILSTTAGSEKFKPLTKNSDADQKAILENIKKNIAGYEIHKCGALSVINIKDDDRTIEVSSKRCRPSNRGWCGNRSFRQRLRASRHFGRWRYG